MGSSRPAEFGAPAAAGADQVGTNDRFQQSGQQSGQAESGGRFGQASQSGPVGQFAQPGGSNGSESFSEAGQAGQTNQPGQFGQPAPFGTGQPGADQSGQYGTGQSGTGQPGQYGQPASFGVGQFGQNGTGQPNQFGQNGTGQNGQNSTGQPNQFGQFGQPGQPHQPGQYGPPGGGWGQNAAPAAGWNAPKPSKPMSPKQKKVILGAAGGALALLLIAVIAVVALRGGEKDGAKAGSNASSLSAPFVDAANSFMAAQGIGYSDGDYNVRVMKNGDMTGTFGGYAKLPILRTDGTTYAKLASYEVRELIPYLDYSFGTDDRWMQIEDSNLDALNVDHVAPESPQVVGQRVLDALNQSTTNFSPSPYGSDDFADLYDTTEPADGATNTEVNLDGTAALMASTPAGPVYITASTPHTLLNVPAELVTGDSSGSSGGSTSAATPSGGSSTQESSSLPDGEALGGSGNTADNVAFSRRTATSPPSVFASDGVSLTEMNTDQISRAYDDMIGYAQKLGGALDARFEVTAGTPKYSCTASRCSYSVEVSTRPYTSGGDATTALVGVVASFTIGDARTAADTCSSTTEVPLNGSKTVSCSTTGTAKQMKAAIAAAKAEARERSKAYGIKIDPTDVRYYTDGAALGVAGVDSAKLVSALTSTQGEFKSGQ